MIEVYDEDDPHFAYNISFYEDSTGVQPWVSKYNFPFVDIGIQDFNWMMFRYADALLMLAECYNEAGGLDTRAVDILEQIRTRAGLPDPTVAVADAESLRQAIADERRRELAFENHRWFDLLRYGTAEEVMPEHGIAQNEQKPTNLPGAYEVIRTTLGVPLRAVEQFGFEQTPSWAGAAEGE